MNGKDWEDSIGFPIEVDVTCNYKIVEKPSTRPLLRFLGEIKLIMDGFETMHFSNYWDKCEVREIVNSQIAHKLGRIYRFYSRHHNVSIESFDWGEDNQEFSRVYRVNKTIENNLDEICESIRSWENE